MKQTTYICDQCSKPMEGNALGAVYANGGTWRVLPQAKTTQGTYRDADLHLPCLIELLQDAERLLSHEVVQR